MVTHETTFGPRTELPTSVADLGSIVRFNSNNFYTSHFSLVLDEVLQLVETPITNPIVHNPTSVLFPDTFQVFHYNLASVEFGNNIFTDIMVNPSHITSFTPTELLEKSYSGTSAFGLQFTTQVLEFPFDLLDFRRLIEPVVRSDSKVIYSEVNAQNNVLRTNVLLSGIELFRECEHKKASSSLIHPQKETFIDIPTKIPFVAFGDFKLELLPAFEQSQYKHISFGVSTSREIVSYRCSFDSGFGFSFLDHPTCLLYTSDSNLGWQFELISDCMINFIMEFKVLLNFMLPCIIDTELQGFSVSFNSIDYLFSRIDSDFCSHTRSHRNIKEEQVYKCIDSSSHTTLQRRYALIPTLKGRVSELMVI